VIASAPYFRGALGSVICANFCSGELVMALKLYRVVLTGRSALKVERQRGWKNPQYYITIKDDLQKDASSASPKHAGLIYTVEVSAEDAVDSIQKATSYARHITDHISVVHGAAIDYPLPRFSIDIDTTYTHRELAQIFYDAPALQHPRRTYNQATYKFFFKQLDSLRQDNPRSAMRIDRALHYLRSSYLEQEPIDRFEDAWGALEAVNPLIFKKYSLGTTYQKKCRNCNAPIPAPDNASGIDYILKQFLGKSAAVAKELRAKRIDIVHARASLSKVLENIAENTRLAQRAAVVGILDALDLPKKQESDFMREMLPVTGSPQLLVRAILYDLSVEALRAQAQYPQLYLLRIMQVETSNRPMAHAGETRPLAAQLNIGMRHFSGNWDLQEIRWQMYIDPEDDSPETQIMAVKSILPDKEA
jgi:hypothetical protein